MIFFRAGVPLQVQGGNCEEHADLTFVWLMQNTVGLTLNYAMGTDHAFIIVGDLKSEQLDDCIVVDPWTTASIVGRYGDGRAQDVKSYEVTGVQTGVGLAQLNQVLGESQQLIGQQDTGYSSDEEENYTERAKRAYPL